MVRTNSVQQLRGGKQKRQRCGQPRICPSHLRDTTGGIPVCSYLCHCYLRQQLTATADGGHERGGCA